MDVVLVLLRALLAVLLYVFLAAVLLVLWRDLRCAAGARPSSRPQGRLIVVEGGEGPPQPGSVFTLQEVTSIGRLPDNTLVFAEPFVSAHHALLTWREEHWWLEDLGSKNGTTLNGEPVTQPTIVSAGDLIGIGRVVLRVEE